DTDLRTFHQLVRLLTETNQQAQAEQVLQRLTKQAALAPDRQKLLLDSVAPMLGGGNVTALLYNAVPKDSLNHRDHAWLGQRLWDAGQRREAVEEFRTAATQAGGVAENWLLLVQALGQIGEREQARSAVEEAARQAPPGHAEAVRAGCLEALRDFDAALLAYEQALRSRPNDATVLRRYSRLLLSRGRANDAEKLF